CIERCLDEVSRSERIALVAPAVVYAHDPERLWFAGGKSIDWLSLAWNRGPFDKAAHPPPSADCAHAPACCVLVSTAAWREVGPFREDFFMYFEDTEWCERARGAGWRIRYLGEVLCRHDIGSSSGQKGSRYLTETSGYYLSRNPLRQARDHRGPLRVARLLSILTIWNAYNLTRIRPAEWSTVGRACVEGLVDGWRGRMGRRDLVQARKAAALLGKPGRGA
ncbi:MAG: glycosyl transferase family 2, partial [Acidimicrobiaceae bacterium]|nr:glycosyl transferase family 2 [Acidimicrobiaceae bacterium]